MLTLLKDSEIDVVSLAEVKAHLRLDHSEDDYLITIIKSATDFVENYLGKSLISKTWRVIKHFNEEKGVGLQEIPLPYPPLLEILSVEKVFSNDHKNPVKRYYLETSGSLPKLILASCFEPVEVTYRAGYGDYPKYIPASIRQAILMKVADFYENRTTACYKKSPSEENIFKDLLAPYRQVGLR